MPDPKIMVVEDELIVALDIELALKNIGYEIVTTTQYGEEAEELARAERPDLVLMDISLAGAMDGIEAAEAIHKNLGIPVIFLTAFADDKLLERAKTAEPFGYLVKPFSPQEIRTSIEIGIYKGRMERKLKESEERFRLVADFTYDWETWMGTDGNYVYVSPSCEKVSGYPAEDFMNNPGLMIQIAHPDDHDVVAQHFQEDCFQGKGLSQFDFRITTKGGEERWISHHCHLAYDRNEILAGSRGSNRDVTKRKAVEKEKEALIVELTEALGKVKTLSGLLPICANCKKIRDDSGYWQQIELFIRERSEAEFSHSICPDCLTLLYPEFADKDEPKS